MRLSLLVAALLASVSIAVPAASAQAPTVTLTIGPGQTAQQLIFSGFQYQVSSTAGIEFDPVLTTKVKGRTVVLTRALRRETNYASTADPVSYSLPSVSDRTAAFLRKLKKPLRVTLSVAFRGIDTGATGTATKSATLKLR